MAELDATPIEGEDRVRSAYVLIVDDVAYVRAIVSRKLQHVGVRSMAEAVDVASARDALAKYGPNIVLLDIDMPGETGLGLLRQIRAGETAAPRGLPVVILTSVNCDDVLRNALELDADAFVSKEDELSGLVEKMGRALSHPVAVQPSAHYAKADTLPSAYVEHLAAMTRSDVIDRRGTHMSAADFDVGETLPGDLLTHRGQFLLAAGTRLSRPLLARLGDIEAVFGLRLREPRS